MFRDLRDQLHDRLEPLTVVRVADDERQNEDVSYALQALRNESAVVEWYNNNEREAFLASIRAVARR